MRKIYIAADGGGTKLGLCALSPSGERLCEVRVNGGINKKTAKPEEIYGAVKTGAELMKEKLGGFAALGVSGYFMHNTDVFSKVFGCEAREVDEGTLGLYAAGIYGDGVLILSGTGADAYVIKDGAVLDIMGGYGAFLGDPGSGFAIGAAAINAAIDEYNGAGEKTLLTKYLCEKYPAETFRGSVYGVYAAPQPSREIADFCLECEKAADEGDSIALRIFREAANALSGFAAAGYKKYSLDKNTPYTFSGGVLRHDMEREKPLLLPYIISALDAEGIKNRVMPKGSPLYGAEEWIRRNVIKLKMNN